ncbi:sodium:calcium antiporter [Thermococcus sp.]|uniref:sodium:calcium antiporter n=1 Tax=Thermococcus sp. TaxID=35749 RepID=UPI00262D76E6|nr:sodium:calcium antiporter [Thermococcus sp.]
MDIIVTSVIFTAGIVFLIKGSDLFIGAATRTARDFGVSEFIIALVLASIATTLPEMTVSALAAYRGESGIAVGNGVGSALANIALILGVSSMIKPLRVDRIALKNSLFLLGVTGYLALLMMDGTISRLDGLSLTLIYAAFLYYLYKNQVSLESPEGENGPNPWRDTAIMFGSGLLVVAGAEMVIRSAVEIARAAGIPEVVIGLTLVSIGTSLPELTNSLMATLRNLPNISVGNIIGADILDILMVIGIAALIRPLHVGGDVLRVTMPLTLTVMLALSVSLKRNSSVGRLTGAVFLAVYAVFLYIQFLS